VKDTNVNKFHQLRDDDPIFSNPTGAVLTLGAVEKLSAASAHTLAKFEAMSELVAGLNKKLTALAADMAAYKAHREGETLAKAASEAFRAQQ